MQLLVQAFRANGSAESWTLDLPESTEKGLPPIISALQAESDRQNATLTPTAPQLGLPK